MYYDNSKTDVAQTILFYSKHRLVYLNWSAELLMGNLAEHKNAAVPVQIRSD